MKYVRILGLTVLATAALMAMTGAASATSLTSPSGTIYTSTIKGENEGAVTITSVFGGFGAVSCKKSNFEGKVEKHGTGVTVVWTIIVLRFTECTGGTVRSPVEKPGSMEFHWFGLQVTTKTLILIIDQTAFGTCTFTTPSTGSSIGSLTMTSETGANATLDLKGTLSSACGNGTLEGSYKITTPSTLYADS